MHVEQSLVYSAYTITQPFTWYTSNSIYAHRHMQKLIGCFNHIFDPVSYMHSETFIIRLRYVTLGGCIISLLLGEHFSCGNLKGYSNKGFLTVATEMTQNVVKTTQCLQGTYKESLYLNIIDIIPSPRKKSST